MNEKRKAYVEKFDAQMNEWSAQIGLLKAKAENAKADAKIEFQKTIEQLQHKHDEAGTRLQKLKATGDEAWEILKADSEKVWKNAMTAFHKATSKYK